MSRITVPIPTRGRAPSHSPPDMHYAPGYGLARGLGWFSIGLGLMEIFAPQVVAKWTGVHHPGLLRAFGMREVASGVGILSSDRPSGWMWSRVAGDAIDLAAIGEALAEARPGSERYQRALVAAAAVAGVMTVDVMCSAGLSAASKLEG